MRPFRFLVNLFTLGIFPEKTSVQGFVPVSLLSLLVNLFIFGIFPENSDFSLFRLFKGFFWEFVYFWHFWNFPGIFKHCGNWIYLYKNHLEVICSIIFLLPQGLVKGKLPFSSRSKSQLIVWEDDGFLCASMWFWPDYQGEMAQFTFFTGLQKSMQKNHTKVQIRKQFDSMRKTKKIFSGGSN